MRTSRQHLKTRVNGPFMLQDWDVDEQKFEIVQNPNWWGDKKPFIERIIATPSADENISFIMWQNDEVDIAFFLTKCARAVGGRDVHGYSLRYKPVLHLLGRRGADRRPQRAASAGSRRRLAPGDFGGLGRHPRRPLHVDLADP